MKFCNIHLSKYYDNIIFKYRTRNKECRFTKFLFRSKIFNRHSATGIPFGDLFDIQKYFKFNIVFPLRETKLFIHMFPPPTPSSIGMPLARRGKSVLMAVNRRFSPSGGGRGRISQTYFNLSKHLSTKTKLSLNNEQGTRNVDLRSSFSDLKSSIDIPCSIFKSIFNLILSYYLSNRTYLKRTIFILKYWKSIIYLPCFLYLNMSTYLKPQKRLSAFTLLEMMIALSLSAMVLLMGASIYRIFISFQKGYEQKLDHTTSLSLLSSQLKKDCFAAWEMNAHENGFALLKRNGEPLIDYRFEENIIIRSHSLATDSLPFKGSWQLFPQEHRLVIQDSLTGIPFSFAPPERAAAKPISASPIKLLHP